jgi:hypothetical protein
MATTTPNYGWPVPTSTDYVKDGATAIEALGDAIDATVFGLPSGALTHINTTTFSAVASQSINDVFTSTYDNYVVKINSVGSANGDYSMRVRASGTDLTTSTYNRTFISRSGAAFSTDASVATSVLFNLTRPTKSDAEFSFFSPNLLERTSFLSNAMYIESGSNHANVLAGAVVNNALAYDGFTIFPASGTITGTIRVYGVQN